MARPYDIVIFGASGFTGGLVAEYFARHVPPESTRWALGGRNRAQLEAVRARLARLVPACSELPLLVADAGDSAALHELARSTRVVLSTVGPFGQHGEPLFAACVEQGTDYVDSCGEPTFVRDMLARYGERARDRGVRLVSCCGMDSVPTDLGLYFTMRELAPRGSVRVEAFFSFRMRPSGGTWRSMLEAARRAHHSLRLPAPLAGPGRHVRRVSRGLHHQTPFGWAVPLPSADLELALRSAAALDSYGPDVAFELYLAVPRLWQLVGLGALAGSMIGLSQLSWTRSMLARAIPAGSGPTAAERAKNWFSVRFRAEHAGRILETEVSGGDPAYDETSKMLAESALCLVQDRDRLPRAAGVLTPACAFGDVLLERLVRAGLVFRVVGS